MKTKEQRQIEALLREGFNITDCRKARKAAVEDIKEELKKEGKTFIKFSIEFEIY